MHKILFALLGFVSFIVVSPGSTEAAARRSMLAEAKTGLSVTTDDRILGNPDAPITIVEYASLTCHIALISQMRFCRAQEEVDRYRQGKIGAS